MTARICGYTKKNDVWTY